MEGCGQDHRAHAPEFHIVGAVGVLQGLCGAGHRVHHATAAAVAAVDEVVEDRGLLLLGKSPLLADELQGGFDIAG